MGAGRKTKTLVLQNNPPPQQTPNHHPCSARNTRKKDLAGVIFGCKHSTFKECVLQQLFGLPSAHFVYVQHITPGMPLFLFNYSDRKLHGIYEATSYGQMYINQYAWTLEGEDVTPFPAQVRVKVRMHCHPVSEEQFKPILAHNYSDHEPNHFWFELDQDQTNKLISLFSAYPVKQSETDSRTAAKWGNLFRQTVAPVVIQEDRSLGNGKGKERLVAVSDQDKVEKQEKETIPFEGKTWNSLFKAQTDSTSRKEDEGSSSEGSFNMSEDETSPMSEAICIDEAPLMSEMPSVPSCNEVDVMSEVPSAETHISSDLICFTEEIISALNSEHQAGVNKLNQAIEDMKAIQLHQTRKIRSLEQDLVEAKTRIRALENFHQGSGQSKAIQSTGQLQELQAKRSTQESCSSVLLVGGFSGSSWLQNLDLYMPSDDVIQPLKPMRSIRSYASTVKLKDTLYVLGGASGSSWFDTVESYNLKDHQWMSCPPLNRKKGCLAGVSFCDKIFAIGGGNASECFSDVEMLDLDVGKWILTRSMSQKRFSPAAAQMNGVFYVVGGYDGYEYLKSMERFDPRVHSWTRLNSMKTTRGCHSLTVLNDKLFAIGGYDGAKMVPTVEVFEPRIGSWIMSERMKYARGYMGSVTLGNTIYVIGGMQENEEVLDTVECYSEDKGWQLADLKSIGKRCFFSAFVV